MGRPPGPYTPEFDTYDVHLFRYPTQACRELGDIHHQGEFLASFLREVLPTYKSTLLVGHSMGGLVILNALLKLDHDQPVLIDAGSIRIATFSTPYAGSADAELLSLLCSNRQVTDLKRLSESLQMLRNEWIGNFERKRNGEDLPAVPLYTFYGTTDRIVPKESACLKILESCEPVDGDHSGSVKPRDRNHLTYKKIEILAKAPRIVSPKFSDNYDDIYTLAASYKGQNRMKDYVDTLEALLLNQPALNKLDPKERSVKEGQIHSAIASGLGMADYIDGIEDRVERALKHVEKARLIRGDHPGLLMLKGVLEAERYRDSASPKVVNRIDGIFARAKSSLDALGLLNGDEGLLYYLFQGKALYALRQYDRAREAFQNGLDLDKSVPNRNEALREDLVYRLGLVELFGGHQLEKAREVWNTLSNKQYVRRALVEVGFAYWHDGWRAGREGHKDEERRSYDSAQRTLSEAVRLGERSMELSLVLGIVYFSKEEYLNAESSFEEVTRLNLSNVQGFYWLGRSRFILKKYPLSAQSMGRALELDPQNSDAHYWYGRSLDKLNQRMKATDAYEKSIDLDGDNLKVYPYFIRNLVEEAVAEKSSDARIQRLNGALSVCRRGESRGIDGESAAELQKIKGLKSIIMNSLAYEYAERGELLDLAHRYSDEALTYDPDNPYFADTKAWVLTREAEITEKAGAQKKDKIYEIAENLISSSLTRYSNEDKKAKAESLYHLGYLARLRGDEKKARQHFVDALQLDPTHTKSQAALK
jgi:tetratricopeptide (TPR) repeat protein